MQPSTEETLHCAEYVSPGHPDRLADAIAERIVALAPKHYGWRSLVGIEVAVHDDQVFIDGRFATMRNHPRKQEEITETMNRLARDAFADAGYGTLWNPDPENLHINNVTCIEHLEYDEVQIRDISDDQNLVIGYAEPSPGTNCLPPAHFLANRIGRALWEWRGRHADTYGPDFKVLPLLRRIPKGAGYTWRWERLTLSLQHRSGIYHERQHEDLLPFLEETLAQIQNSTGLEGIATSFSINHLHLNGAGDFCQGGPQGDNGLSGKKLVVDHYGPDIPIGGGAICGKDAYKVDRVGPLRARQLAKMLALQTNLPARVRLGWSPGDSVPFLTEAALLEDNAWRALPGNRLPPQDWFSITTIFHDLELHLQDWPQVLLDGYFMEDSLPWEVSSSTNSQP